MLRPIWQKVYLTMLSPLNCDILLVVTIAFRYSTITAELTAMEPESTCLITEFGSRLLSSVRKACDLQSHMILLNNINSWHWQLTLTCDTDGTTWWGLHGMHAWHPLSIEPLTWSQCESIVSATSFAKWCLDQGHTYASLTACRWCRKLGFCHQRQKGSLPFSIQRFVKGSSV